MIKRISGTALTLALAAWLAFIPPGVPAAAAAGSFKDTGSHWSRQVVEKSYFLDLIKGYPGNVFKPEDPVTRLEAIAIIIRAMGLEEQAKKTDYKNSGIALPQGMFWGQGHLVVAVQKGLLHRDYTQQLLVNNPITRAEVATLVSLALQDKLKVKGDVQKLTYTDNSKINPYYQQYVADVTQNNIMQGLGNNEFGPNEVMKRGQMAALLVKAVQDGWFEFGRGKIIAGALTAIDSATGIITLTKADGTQLDQLVDTSTVYYKNLKVSSLSDFRIGDPVLAVAELSVKVKYLEYTGSAASPPGGELQEQDLAGKIVDRILAGGSALKIRDMGYRDHLYPLAPAVIITDGTGAKDLSYLADGQYVAVKVKDNAIHSIRVTPSETDTGEVTAVIPGNFTLKNYSGSSKMFRVKSDELKVARGDSRLPFTDLKTGDRVKVVSVAGEAREIIMTSSTIEAEVRTVDSYYRMITVLNGNTRKEYEVETSAVITKGNDTVRIDSLKQGDRITFKVGNNGKIKEIQAVGEGVKRVSGKVTDIKTGSNPRIYVDSTRYYIDSNADVTRDGDDIDLDDIMIGSEVALDLDEDDMVAAIEVTDDQDITVEGTVTDVDESRNRITIEQASGQEFTLRVNSNCSFRDSTSSSSSISHLGDIRDGWDVKLYLENGKVTTIRVMDR